MQVDNGCQWVLATSHAEYAMLSSMSEYTCCEPSKFESMHITKPHYITLSLLDVLKTFVVPLKLEDCHLVADAWPVAQAYLVQRMLQ